jgi:hypothetical protein
MRAASGLQEKYTTIFVLDRPPNAPCHEFASQKALSFFANEKHCSSARTKSTVLLREQGALSFRANKKVLSF